MDNQPKFIIVVGASAGGINAITELISNIKPGLDAAYFIVLHLSRTVNPDFLLHRLMAVTPLQCKLATDAETFQKDHIYLAPANRHLVLKKGKIVLSFGPEENRWRPSIDVLFRSAATSYNSHTIGVVLSGLLNDGTAGMSAIQRCGGTTIVQSPNEAEYPDMPLSVLETLEVDHTVSLAEMGNTIAHIISNFKSKEVDIPPDLQQEVYIAEVAATGYEQVMNLGEESLFTCPDCNGRLFHLHDNDKIQRYRCQIGHSYSEADLVLRQAEQLESTLWVALRIMEERKTLMQKLADDYKKKGLASMHASYKLRTDELIIHIGKLKDLLFHTEIESDYIKKPL
jgi:two-component system, chemotaxis family, protein-glutamate methylesterase/glutaminase